jgi:UDPglucose--hexose-1-phosphate uridylyltransferase
LVGAADRVLSCWRGYTDEKAFIFSETQGVSHNTITPIARKRGDLFELDLVLRNNITTEEFPLGVYHPHPEYHHIKKENIGLIEVMGLAVLPARLQMEMAELERRILQNEDLRESDLTKSHAEWAEKWMPNYEITEENIHAIVQKEIGIVFAKVLECAGVYKRTPEGKAAFQRFLDCI